jgi:hypothetical protein
MMTTIKSKCHQNYEKKKKNLKNNYIIYIYIYIKLMPYNLNIFNFIILYDHNII